MEEGMSPGEWVNRTKAGVTQARPDPDRNIPVKRFRLCSCSCSCFRLFGAIPFFFGTGKRVCVSSPSLSGCACRQWNARISSFGAYPGKARGRGRREGLSALYTDSCALGDGPVRAKGRSAPKEETGKTILERSKKPGRKKGGNAQPSPPHNLPGLYTTTSLALPLLIFKMLCSSILTRTMLSSHIRRKLY